MTPIKTITINLPPADMLRLLRAIETTEPAQGFALVASAHGTKVTTLDVHVEGSVSAHVIRLRDDGTWTAETAVEA